MTAASSGYTLSHSIGRYFVAGEMAREITDGCVPGGWSALHQIVNVACGDPAVVPELVIVHTY